LLSNKSKRKWKIIEKREVETIFKAIEKKRELKRFMSSMKYFYLENI